jgi:hypothetical protein
MHVNQGWLRMLVVPTTLQAKVENTARC